MDNNNNFNIPMPKNLFKKIETMHCGICTGSFRCRTDLYEHFQDLHNISQEFRNEFGPNKQIAKYFPSIEQNLHKQINEMNKAQHTITQPTSQAPHNIQPVTTSSTVVSSLENSLQSISLAHLPKGHIGSNLVSGPNVGIPAAAILSRPKATCLNILKPADLNSGLARHRSIYHPYNSNDNMNKAQPTTQVPGKIQPVVTSSTVASSLENRLSFISPKVKHLPTQHIRSDSERESTEDISTGAIIDKPKPTLHYLRTTADSNSGFTRHPQRSNYQPYKSHKHFIWHPLFSTDRVDRNFADKENSIFGLSFLRGPAGKQLKQITALILLQMFLLIFFKERGEVYENGRPS